MEFRSGIGRDRDVAVGQKCNHGDKRPWEQKWDHRDSIMGREWAHSGRGGAVGIKDGTRVEVT